MRPEDWPVGATFTYNSPYGPSSWIGVVKEGRFENGSLAVVESTKGIHYNLIQINLETKEEFTARLRQDRFGELGL
jgi:hypothetical protein